MKGAARAARGQGDPTPVPLEIAKTALAEHFRARQWEAVERDSHWWDVTRGVAPLWPRESRTLI